MKVNLTLKIEDVKIKSGQIFDFVGVMDNIHDLNKIYLIYKFRSSDNKIIFTFNQAMYFTVKGKPMNLPLYEDIEKTEPRDLSLPWDNTKKNSLNFVDSFVVLKGNDGINKHQPNLDINQPIIGIGTEWMLSAIEKKQEKLVYEKLMYEMQKKNNLENQKKAEEEKKKKEILKAKEEENKLKIKIILEKEDLLASNENEYETFTRHYLNLSTEIIEYIKTQRNG